MSNQIVESADKKRIKFRNYRPHDNSLLGEKIVVDSVVTVTTNKLTENTAVLEIDGSGYQKKNEIEHAKNVEIPVDIILKELAENSSEELHIVPKKPNWDLKNQISDSLNKLKKKTQKSIVEILREKLENEQRTDSEGESS